MFLAQKIQWNILLLFKMIEKIKKYYFIVYDQVCSLLMGPDLKMYNNQLQGGQLIFVTVAWLCSLREISKTLLVPLLLGGLSYVPHSQRSQFPASAPDATLLILGNR